MCRAPCAGWALRRDGFSGSGGRLSVRTAVGLGLPEADMGALGAELRLERLTGRELGLPLVRAAGGGRGGRACGVGRLSRKALPAASARAAATAVSLAAWACSNCSTGQPAVMASVDSAQSGFVAAEWRQCEAALGGNRVRARRLGERCDRRLHLLGALHGKANGNSPAAPERRTELLRPCRSPRYWPAARDRFQFRRWCLPRWRGQRAGPARAVCFGQQSERRLEPHDVIRQPGINRTAPTTRPPPSVAARSCRDLHAARPGGGGQELALRDDRPALAPSRAPASVVGRAACWGLGGDEAEAAARRHGRGHRCGLPWRSRRQRRCRSWPWATAQRGWRAGEPIRRGGAGPLDIGDQGFSSATAAIMSAALGEAGHIAAGAVDLQHDAAHPAVGAGGGEVGGEIDNAVAPLNSVNRLAYRRSGRRSG